MTMDVNEGPHIMFFAITPSQTNATTHTTDCLGQRDTQEALKSDSMMEIQLCAGSLLYHKIPLLGLLGLQ